MFRLISGIWILSAALAAHGQSAPVNPSTGMPQQPGQQQQQPGQSQPGQQQQPGDPNAVPMAPPTFAPGVGAGDEASPSSQHKVIRISGGVLQGNLVTKVDPVYPEKAKVEHKEGTVVLMARIGKDGHVENLSVISGPSALRSAAMDAVKQWVYRPYQLNGQSVEVDSTVTLNFSLQP